MSLWLPCGLHGSAVPNTVTVTVICSRLARSVWTSKVLDCTELCLGFPADHFFVDSKQVVQPELAALTLVAISVVSVAFHLPTQ
jgi:hypothetical protein